MRGARRYAAPRSGPVIARPRRVAGSVADTSVRRRLRSDTAADRECFANLEMRMRGNAVHALLDGFRLMAVVATRSMIPDGLAVLSGVARLGAFRSYAGRMKRIILLMLFLVVLPATEKAHAASCATIRRAVASGWSTNAVARQFHVPRRTVE